MVGVIKMRHVQICRVSLNAFSIVPVVLTLLLLEGPTLLLIGHLYHTQLLPNLPTTALLILNLFAIVLLVACLCTDPGIIPQNVNNYEWDE